MRTMSDIGIRVWVIFAYESNEYGRIAGFHWKHASFENNRVVFLEIIAV